MSKLNLDRDYSAINVMQDIVDKKQYTIGRLEFVYDCIRKDLEDLLKVRNHTKDTPEISQLKERLRVLGWDIEGQKQFLKDIAKIGENYLPKQSCKLCDDDIEKIKRDAVREFLAKSNDEIFENEINQLATRKLTTAHYDENTSEITVDKNIPLPTKNEQ